MNSQSKNVILLFSIFTKIMVYCGCKTNESANTPGFIEGKWLISFHSEAFDLEMELIFEGIEIEGSLIFPLPFIPQDKTWYLIQGTLIKFGFTAALDGEIRTNVYTGEIVDDTNMSGTVVTTIAGSETVDDWTAVKL